MWDKYGQLIFYITPFIFPFLTISFVKTILQGKTLIAKFTSAILFTGMLLFTMFSPVGGFAAGLVVLANIFSIIVGLTFCLSEPGKPKQDRLGARSYYLLVILLVALVFARVY